MFFQIILQIFYGRIYPHATWIWTEKVASHPHCRLLKKAFVLCVYRIDFHSLFAMSGSFQEVLVESIWLYDSCLENFCLCRYLIAERLVYCQLFRIFGSIYYRLPTFLWKVFGEFHPTLYSRASRRWPIICNDKYAFHNLAKIHKFGIFA